jgi:hypothetical protein
MEEVYLKEEGRVEKSLDSNRRFTEVIFQLPYLVEIPHLGTRAVDSTLQAYTSVVLMKT